MAKRLVQGPANPVWLVRSDGEPIDTTHPMPVVQSAAPTPLPFTFGALTTQTMGNAVPAEVVPGNAARRALIVTNISDVYAYFSFGNGVGLTTAIYAWLLPPGIAVYIDESLSTQAIAAICGDAAKDIAYQEAV